MRKLCSIQKIIDLRPIENADKIEIADIKGWHVVVVKGLHKIGDMVVYCEVDSLLPVLPELEFLASRGTKTLYVEGKEYVGYRLKTVKLRGQISQGLALPLTILKGRKFPNDKRENPEYVFKEGDDVTALLGVIKYEAPIPAHLAGKVKGLKPGWFPKTDEDRIQAFPKVLERNKNKGFYITEKLDGSSVSIYFKNGDFGVCSRNLDLLRDENNSIWKTALALDLENKLTKLGRNIALQGEIVGFGIQKNPLKLNNQIIFFFDVYDIDTHKYLDLVDFKLTIKKLGLQTVPIFSEDFILTETVDELVKLADRGSAINKGGMVEGIVMRTMTEQTDEELGRLSFKILNPNYLLKYE